MYNWPQKPFILAHRGARNLAPENTLEAFRKAFELGADGFECDVFLSGDGVPVILHDETLDRTTQGKGFVWEHTSQELHALGVPTLEEALETCVTGGIINVELKGCLPCSPLELFDRVNALLGKHAGRIQAIISSFDPKLLEPWRGYPVGLLFESDQVLEVPVGLFPDALHVDFSSLGRVPPGYKTVLWTAPTIETARDWISQGVDGVIAEFSSLTLILDASDSESIDQAARILQEGRLVAFATETVYGLGALGLNPTSVQRIFDAKERPSNNPLILHVASVAQARTLFEFPSAEAVQRFELLAEHFWPGPLTLVCDRASVVPSLTTAGSDKVAVRIPNHPVALELLQLVAQPIAAPSANSSGRPSATTAQHVIQTLGGRIDAVLDAGACIYGLESTVVDISGDRPVILRTGAISVDELRTFLPDVVVRQIGTACLEAVGSPGLVAKHYSPALEQVKLVPHAEILRCWNRDEALLIRQETAQLQAKRTLGPTEILPDDPVGYAHELYAALYRLEQSGAKTLLIEEVPQDDSWLAVRDRLMRACA